MGRKIDVDQLVDARGIADRLNWPRPHLVHYFVRTDPDFPDPVWQGSEGRGGLRLWYWPEVDRWATRKHKRREPGSAPDRE